jgi:uncharacterized protein (DUF433 family)
MTLPDFLTQQDDGEITLTGHRIGLFHLVHYYREGYSPEMLACQYPSLPLPLMHKTIAYYLENQAEVDAAFAGWRQELDQQHAEGFSRVDWAELRQRLQARRAAESA